ncbi:plasmid replication DNA-binding protein [Acinetobacter baumannii]|uniref:DNA-binding protein n=22 Tax=Gammaproteobacteria TaxID=1236 RepID=A0A6G6APV8_ACIBA|nr:plasmid replication DNA-binding protein [Acinetobacter baumannii]MDA0712761.1 plasmid replication DNA-binding protein [bacterium]AVE88594.1 helix-turn-helix domain-containing protein [Acinetobacter baumannii]EHZ7972415.1 helix-turn-helix domain-containing protein [Acinetobacter baumannii]EIO2226853.1 helix-turn-helix domain-containing protein [Acinetobacter baumannii]EJD6091431.1 helix-turn-helix domain-containing protein [Acinetobacter baumannii]
MAKLSLSEVSKKFHVDRSTIYRAVRNGRLSRSSDGQFDLAEVIRCFGEPEQTPQKIESSKQEGDESTKKLIAHLENEVKKYQEREERLMQQIDRMQTLIELKSVAPATASPQQDATACDTDMQQHATPQQDNDNKKNHELNIAENVAVPQQENTAYHTQTLQHATLQNVAVPQHKKRGLFGRVLNAVFDND